MKLTIIDAQPQDFLILADEAKQFLQTYAPRTYYNSVLTKLDRLDGRVLMLSVWGDSKHVRVKVLGFYLKP